MTPLDSTSNGEQMHLMVQFFNTGDLSALPSVVATDYVDHQGVGQGPLLGPDGFAGVVRLSRDRHPELSVDIDELHVAGDVVVAKLNWSEPKPRGTEQHTYRRTIEVVRFAEGLAVEHWGERLD
ncbi:MAG: ester cyclase [Dehalococcoidia bacterium]|nr:ester cyclase [Dehalococcoidia bacterium]